jgi:hypothetical protein
MIVSGWHVALTRTSKNDGWNASPELQVTQLQGHGSEKRKRVAQLVVVCDETTDQKHKTILCFALSSSRTSALRNIEFSILDMIEAQNVINNET